MSRTHRNNFYSRSALRHPRTTNEKSQLDEILNDPEIKEFPVDKLNHMQSRRGESGKLPTVYDDMVISAYYETDYDKES
jgi:hypothetical protein